jgi:hypothetical protein
MRLAPFAIALASFLVPLAACRENGGSTVPAPTSTVPVEATEAPVASSAPPVASSAPSPSTSASASANAAPEAGAPRSRCASNADCPAGQHCALGIPLRGVCWPDGRPEPICLSGDARIATPAGEVAARDVTEGMLVWTLDKAGSRIAAPVRQVASTPAPAGHVMSRVVLEDGREVSASPGHPTCGRAAHLGDLRAGGSLDGALVRTAERVAYTGEATFDLLPAGDTGCYWANGVLLGSTLF